MNMYVKKALLWGLLLYTILTVCSPLMMFFEVIPILIANFAVTQAIFFGIADQQICYFGLAGLLVMMLLIGAAYVKRNRLGSLCGAAVVVGDLIYAGSILIGDLFNSYINTVAIQACMFDIVVTLLYILYYVGEIKGRSIVHKQVEPSN